MVLYIGNEPIAGYSTNTKMNAHSLLDFKFCDHILNELSWVNADTFSWLSGDVYTAVYNKLVAEYDTGTTGTETGVSYKKSDNGFKIADASQEQAVINAYNSTGVAWFYILDTANRRFKLPRTKYNKYMSQVAVKGNGMTLGLTDGTINIGLSNGSNSGYGGLTTIDNYGTNIGTNPAGTFAPTSKTIGITTDPTKSGMVADLSTDTNMLLYFYVGEFAQSAIEQTAGYAQTLTEKKADINLSNSTAITNCITEIPQDIKLELDNGTLTLKAGSKVYVPNGVGVFDVVTVPNDVVFHKGTIGSNTQDMMLCCKENGEYGFRGVPAAFCSGSTDSLTGTQHVWYDTNNNLVKYYESGASADNYVKCGFPIGIYHRTEGIATEIKQVFNGFGYIGSTVFALPNVKGLIPNGRNADGSLKNIEFTTTDVTTLTLSGGWSGYNDFILGPNGIGTNIFRYDENDNYLYYGNQIQTGYVFAQANIVSTVVKSLVVKTAFHALDYNDKSTISGWGMPSNRYIDLTLGASGSTYTAPANGYVAIRQYFSAANGSNFIGIYTQNPAGIDIMQARPVASDVATFLPIKSGREFRVYYSTLATNSASYFRFIYAEGDQ